MNNEKNIVLITGSSRGIGFAIAKEFDKKGANTILTGRSKGSLKNAAHQLKNHCLTYEIDFLKKNQVKKFLDYLINNNLTPNIIVHNVGGPLKNDFFPLDLKILKTSMNLHLEVAVQINETFLPQMKEKKHGRIIHISSDASLTGKASPAYVISKAAINAYVKNTARHYANKNIMLCAVLPGIIEDEGSVWQKKKFTQPDYYQEKLNQMPIGRFGFPEEISNFVVALGLSKSMMCAGSLFELRGAVS